MPIVESFGLNFSSNNSSSSALSPSPILREKRSGGNSGNGGGRKKKHSLSSGDSVSINIDTSGSGGDANGGNAGNEDESSMEMQRHQILEELKRETTTGGFDAKNNGGVHNRENVDELEAELKELEAAAKANAEAKREESLKEYRRQINASMGIKLIKLVENRYGIELFDELCVRIDVNQKYVDVLPQWKDLADLLQVDTLRTRWIETCVRPKEGLTKAMLEIYMQDNGTLGEVLDGLLKLQCLDILETIRPKVDLFLTHLPDDTNNGRQQQIKQHLNDDSQYFSILETLAKALPGSKDPCFKLQDFSHGLKKYNSSIMSPRQHQQELIVGHSTLSTSSTSLNKKLFNAYDPKQHSDLKRIKKDWEKVDKICRILLVFASDGVAFAENARNLIQGYSHQVIYYSYLFPVVLTYVHIRDFLYKYSYDTIKNMLGNDVNILL